MSKQNPEWSPAMNGALRVEWATDASAAAIARSLSERFGVIITKNAVVGRAGRMGLPRRPSPIKPPAPAPARQLPTWSPKATLSPPHPPAAATRPRHPMAAPAAGAGATPSAVCDAPPERAGPASVAFPPFNSAGAAPKAAPAPLPGGNERGCRWPLWGNERPTHLYCGEARRDLACPYCPTHAGRAYVVRLLSAAPAAAQVQQPQVAPRGSVATLGTTWA